MSASAVARNRNLDLLERTYAYTVEHRDEWNQAWWVTPVYDEQWNVCGTKCCFAGNALLVAGYRAIIDGWQAEAADR